MNPLWRVINATTDKNITLTNSDKVADANSAQLRRTIGEYIKKRKSGELKSDVGDNSDVMSQMLAASDVYTDSDIVDEVVDFLTAGTQTTQYASQAAFSHLMTCPESMAKVRADFDPFVKSSGSFEAAIKDELTYENIGDFKYITYTW